MYTPVRFEDKGNYYTIYLENEKEQTKNVKIAKKWILTTIEKLELDFWGAVNLWLEDNNYMINEEQNLLDTASKSIAKSLVKSEKKPAKKTQKERTAKENPDKEFIIAEIVKTLQNIDTLTDINITNKAKNVEFVYKNHTYKVDLTQKREPKNVE